MDKQNDKLFYPYIGWDDAISFAAYSSHRSYYIHL